MVNPRTVSPPSAHVKSIVTPHGANPPAPERRPKHPSDRASPFHHKDYNERNKKTRRKCGADYSETYASQKPPLYKENEPEDITLDNKTNKVDGASTPKCLKSRDRTKRKGQISGTTRRKTANRPSAVPHKDSRTSVLPHYIEQPQPDPNKQQRPAIDSTKQRRPAVSPNHTDRQQRVNSPENTKCSQPVTSPDNTERRQTTTLLVATKRQKLATSPDHNECQQPSTSPDQTERRQLITSPKGPKQRQTTAPKDGDRRGRRSVARGDSRAAAVAEAVAHGSSNPAYPIWLRRRSSKPGH